MAVLKRQKFHKSARLLHEDEQNKLRDPAENSEIEMFDKRSD